MVEGTAPFYKLTNFDSKKNCSITAMFPAVVSVKAIDVGDAESKSVNYDVSFLSFLLIGHVFDGIPCVMHHVLKITNPSNHKYFRFCSRQYFLTLFFLSFLLGLLALITVCAVCCVVCSNE